MAGGARRLESTDRANPVKQPIGLRLVTWNVHGTARPDPVAIARAIIELEPDVICFQEIRRHQARRVAKVLGWPRGFWTFKHNAWYVLPFRAEGLAILASNGVRIGATTVLSRPVPWFSHRRRVAQMAWVGKWPIVNTHLSNESDRDRLLELHQLLGFVPTGAIIAGDLNGGAASSLVGALVGAGWQHRTPDPDCPDFVLAPQSARLLSVTVVERKVPWTLLSDHVPVVAMIE